MIISHKLCAFALGAAMLASCGGSKEHETIGETADTLASAAAVTKDTTEVLNDTTRFKFDFAIANIPSPALSVQELAALKAPYEQSFLNDTKKSGSYNSEYLRGMNLGVYNIDMAYAMMHDKGQDVLHYMKSSLVLSDALGLKGAVNMMVGRRAENNLNNKDSLFRILDEIFVKSDSYLRTNERVYTAATVFAGSWLESLYLTCKTGESAENAAVRKKSRELLWEQRFHLGNLLSLLQDYKDRKECAELVRDLKPIHDELETVKEASQLSDSKFSSVSAKLYALRNRITQ